MSHVTENGQSFEIFRNVNPAMLAATTGGASLVTADRIVALWRDGGVTTTVRDGITDWSWRGDLRYSGDVVPDSAVLFSPEEITVVFPAGEHDSVQGFTLRDGRIKRFEQFPALSTDPLRQAATYARDVFVARQEALAR